MMMCYIKLLSFLAAAIPVTTGAHVDDYVANCTGFSLAQSKALNIIISSSGFYCLLIVAIVLFMIAYYKMYKTLIQRLFLYAVIVNALHLVAAAMGIQQQFNYRGQEGFCTVLGFINQVSGGITYVLIAETAICLLVIVYKRLVRSDSGTSTGHCRVLSEIVLVLFAVIFPVLYSLPPFFYHGYGVDGSACWVRSFDEECNYVGFRDQLTFFIIGGVKGLITLVASMLLAVTSTYLYCQRKNSDQQRRTKRLLCRTLFLTSVLVTNVIVLFVGIVLRFYITSFSLSLIYSITIIPFSLLVTPLGYFVYICDKRHKGCCSKCQGSKQERQQILHFTSRPHPSIPSYTVTRESVYTPIGQWSEVEQQNSTEETESQGDSTISDPLDLDV